MSTIKLNFIDDQCETSLYVNPNSKMRDVLIAYLNKINTYSGTLDPNVYVFQLGQKILNKKNNIDKTVEELGLSHDCEIRFTRKEDRNYA